MPDIQFQESIDTFKVKFEGSNSIDAELFTRTINNIIELVKASANAIDPNSFIRLEIKSTNEGSFETIIDAVAKYTPDLINRDNTRLACEIVAGFLAFLQIKNHFKGKKPNSINYKGEKAYIKDYNNEEMIFPKNITQVYIADSKVENIISNIFSDLKQSEKDALNIECNKDIQRFKKEDCENMCAPVISQENKVTMKETSETLKECSLTLRKPDLIGRSKWVAIFAGHTIDVKISDEDFLAKFKKGDIKVFSGCKLICDLNIKTEMDDEYSPTKVEYIALKVHGIKDNEEQLELFE